MTTPVLKPAELRGRIDLGNVLHSKIDRKAVIGDPAVVKMRTMKWLDERFVVGVVTAVSDDGHALSVATARKHPRLQYDAQIHVGDRKKLRGLAAEQIALKLPTPFLKFEDAYEAILQILSEQP